MTTDPIPDRAELLARSAERLRRAIRISLIVFAAVFLGLALVLAVLLDELRNPSFAVAIIAGLAAVGAISLVAVFVGRRHTYYSSVIWGTDGRTTRAVRRALRDGRTDDRRIDALARETAHASLRRRWITPMAIGLILLQVFVLILDVTDADWSAALLRIPMIGIFVALALQRRQEVRRQRGYLGEPGPAGPSETAA